MISVNKDDQMVKIGYILTKNDNEISFIDEKEQKVTIPWTKDLKLNNVFINNWKKFPEKYWKLEIPIL